MKRPVKIYADTSVFGGAVDREFGELSKPFFARVRIREIELVVSSVVLDELEGAPKEVRAFFAEMSSFVREVDITEEANALRRAYLRAGVVSQKWDVDALHVAVATVSGCRAIVSWNFKHIVNYRRIPLYNAVNQAENYASIAIHTPPEVVSDDEEE